MKKVTLGTTGITVEKNGFGALPIQRINMPEAVALLRKAYSCGIEFFDTARFYTDSEEKIGCALSDVRTRIFIASKTKPSSPEDLRNQLNASLQKLKTDYLDIYQFHNPAFCPKPGDGSGLYEAMLEAKEKGLIRHIGISNHRIRIAMEAVESGLYETLQYPFSYLSAADEIGLVKKCKEKGVGFIAMKSLSGGLITHSAAAYAYLAQYDNVLPIWGIQKENELDEFISYMKNSPALDEKISMVIEKDRKELSGAFCRGCGYCLPCPAGIDIPIAARMSLFLKRAPMASLLSSDRKALMRKAEDCIHCGHCKIHCPYGLDTPELIRKNWEEYQTFI